MANGSRSRAKLSLPLTLLFYSPFACSRIDRGRLLRDREYLLHAVCAEFQKAPPLPLSSTASLPLRLQVDTYHRGLITSANFAKAC